MLAGITSTNCCKLTSPTMGQNRCCVSPERVDWEGHRIKTSLVVQWLRSHTSNARGPGSIPGQGTGFHAPHLRACMSQLKLLHATTNTRHNQIKCFLKKDIGSFLGCFPPKVHNLNLQRNQINSNQHACYNNRSILAQNDNIMKDKEILKSFSTIMETQETGQLSVM